MGGAALDINPMYVLPLSPIGLGPRPYRFRSRFLRCGNCAATRGARSGARPATGCAHLSSRGRTGTVSISRRHSALLIAASCLFVTPTFAYLRTSTPLFGHLEEIDGSCTRRARLEIHVS